MKRENSQQTTKRLSAQIARRWRRLNDPAIQLSGVGQNWRPIHLIAFSDGASEQHCPEQLKSLVNDAPLTGLNRIS